MIDYDAFEYLKMESYAAMTKLYITIKFMLK